MSHLCKAAVQAVSAKDLALLHGYLEINAKSQRGGHQTQQFPADPMQIVHVNQRPVRRQNSAICRQVHEVRRQYVSSHIERTIAQIGEAYGKELRMQQATIGQKAIAPIGVDARRAVLPEQSVGIERDLAIVLLRQHDDIDNALHERRIAYASHRALQLRCRLPHHEDYQKVELTFVQQMRIVQMELSCEGERRGY